MRLGHADPMSKNDAEKLFDLMTDPDKVLPEDFERVCSAALLRRKPDPIAELMTHYDESLSRRLAAVWKRRNEHNYRADT
jgi:hypothetical protein